MPRAVRLYHSGGFHTRRIAAKEFSAVLLVLLCIVSLYFVSGIWVAARWRSKWCSRRWPLLVYSVCFLLLADGWFDGFVFGFHLGERSLPRLGPELLDLSSLSWPTGDVFRCALDLTIGVAGSDLGPREAVLASVPREHLDSVCGMISVSHGSTGIVRSLQFFWARAGVWSWSFPSACRAGSYLGPREFSYITASVRSLISVSHGSTGGWCTLDLAQYVCLACSLLLFTLPNC